MAKLIDIVRPGTTLRDSQGHSWKYAGKLSPEPTAAARVNLKARIDEMVTPRWTDKWVREDGTPGTLSSGEVYARFGPLSVILESWTPDSAWFNTQETFEAVAQEQ